MKKILINRTDAIGDTLLTMPMASVFKEHFTNCHVTFLVSKKCIDIFPENQDVDEVKVIDYRKNTFSGFLETWNYFKKNSFDIYVYAGGSHLPSFIALLFKVKIRGGLKSKWQTFLTLNCGVRQHRSTVEMHEFNYNLNLLAPLGIELDVKDLSKYYPKIILTDEEIGNSQNNLKKNILSTNIDFWPDMEYLIIHPGMTGHTLNWPTKNYARLIFQLERKFPGRFLYIISYTPADEAYLKSFRIELDLLKDEKDIKPKTLYLDGSVDGLRNYMGILKNASLFIGPSTGPIHIANILGCKVVGIYSPILVQSSFRWGPIPRDINRVRIVVPDVVCGEQYHCIKDECPYYECMEKIAIDQIVEEVLAIIK